MAQAAKIRVGLIQMRSGCCEAENLGFIKSKVDELVAHGCTYIQTPEMSLVLNRQKDGLFSSIFEDEADNPVPAFVELAQIAKAHGIWLHIGSAAVKASNNKAFNRAVLFSPTGEIIARYDKIHMFDVDLPNGETWRESALYVGGTRAVVCELPEFSLGLSICYDLRFGHLYRQLAKAGALILTCPAAFTKQTGKAHWHTLLRTRAIDNGAFVIAAAQGGVHEDGRETYGHSLVVNPWGEIIAELDHDAPDVLICDIDLGQVNEARSRIPSLKSEGRFAISKIDGNGAGL